MKIVIDNKLPFIKGVFEPLAQVVYASGDSIDADMVEDADAIITRTRTLCNKSLLHNSKVKYIATATIGYDHIDAAYCKTNNIAWNNAPGCNADAVVQYVFSALSHLAKREKFALKDKVLGVVGVGNVGKRVAAFAVSLGMKVLLNDPPRAEKEGGESFVDLQTLQQKADIITFHTPLIKTGKHMTYHLCDAAFLSFITRKPIIINASRGEVCSGEALKDAIDSQLLCATVIDCWENEPTIDQELLTKVDIATFHIAGYSLEGKANATTSAVRQISRFFNLNLDNWSVGLPDKEFSFEKDIEPLKEVELSYPIMDDDALLRSNPKDFEIMRGEYKFRREPDVIS